MLELLIQIMNGLNLNKLQIMEINTYKIEYYGKKVLFYLPNKEDHIQHIIQSTNSFYEIDMLRDLLKFVPMGGVAIDVGANIGNHTLFFSLICGLKTIAFEPSKKSRKILEKNVSINNLDGKVEIFPFALGSVNEEATIIYPDDHNDGMARVVKKSNEGEVVVVKILDEYKLENIVLLKIDVEGMELRVLEGAVETIRRNRPIICIEASTVDEYNLLKLFLYKENYIAVERYNATPTIMFWPKEKAVDYLPFFLSKGNL